MGEPVGRVSCFFFLSFFEKFFSFSVFCPFKISHLSFLFLSFSRPKQIQIPARPRGEELVEGPLAVAGQLAG